MAELEHGRKMRQEEIDEEFRDGGLVLSVPYEGQRYPGFGGNDQYYEGDHPYNYGKGNYGRYGNWDPFHFVPPYEGKDSNTKYLDENPKWRKQNSADVEGFLAVNKKDQR